MPNTLSSIGLSGCECVIWLPAALLVTLVATSVAGLRGWLVRGCSVGRTFGATAAVFASGFGLWLVFAGLADRTEVPAALWAMPLDRLVGVVILAGLAWAVVPPRVERRAWSVGIVAALAVTMAVYALAAPAWAQSQMTPAPAAWPVRMIRTWELVELSLAAVLLWHLRGEASFGWLKVVLAILAVGSGLQWLRETANIVPVWSHYTTMLAGGAVVGVAAYRGSTRHAWWARGLSERLRRAPPAPVSPAGRIDLADAVGFAEPAPRCDLPAAPIDAGQPADNGLADTAVRAAGMPAAPPAVDAASGRAAAAPRQARAEHALDWLPCGVILSDEEDRIVAVNPVARQLLHRPDLGAGMIVADAFPSAERAELVLHRVRRGSATGTGVVAATFDSPAVRLEAAPLCGEELGYLGAVLMVFPATMPATHAAAQLVPALAGALRAPMASILGYSDLLGQMHGLGAHQIDRYVHRIDANLSRMQTLLANLLLVAEIVDGLGPSVPRTIPIDAALSSAVDRAEPQMREKGVSVHLDVDPSLPPASADPTTVDQVMDNLFTYAVTRSAQGGSVTAAARLVRDADDQRALLISVCNYGRNPVGGANGIVDLVHLDTSEPGLAVVQILAERTGGRAWAEVGPQGVHLNVRLPVAVAA